jgi:hypothetical protein
MDTPSNSKKRSNSSVSIVERRVKAKPGTHLPSGGTTNYDNATAIVTTLKKGRKQTTIA